MREVQSRYPFKTIAIITLPDHLHVIWQLPGQDVNYSVRWQKIKALFTSALIDKGIILKKDNRNEYNLWQRRFWEHTIRNESDLEAHINYIHYNSVKHNLTKEVKDWPYSSFHRYVKDGFLAPDWSSGNKITYGDFGES